MKFDLLEQLQKNPELPTLAGSAYQIMQIALDPEVFLNEMADVIMKEKKELIKLAIRCFINQKNPGLIK